MASFARRPAITAITQSTASRPTPSTFSWKAPNPGSAPAPGASPARWWAHRKQVAAEMLREARHEAVAESMTTGRSIEEKQSFKKMVRRHNFLNPAASGDEDATAATGTVVNDPSDVAGSSSPASAVDPAALEAALAADLEIAKDAAVSSLASVAPSQHDVAVSANGTETETDMVWGTPVATIGDKRIFVASVAALRAIPVWEQQRTYRHARARKIADDKIKKAAKSSKQQDAALSFPGVITVFERAWVQPPTPSPSSAGATTAQIDEARQRFAVVDGQHRVGALRLLADAGRAEERVVVEVVRVGSEAEAAELFKDINKAEPVKDVDLPGNASEHERSILETAAVALSQKFPEFFKESTKCRRPHLNVDNLRDALFKSKVVGRHGMVDDEDLLSWMLAQNDALEARSDDDWAAAVGATAAASPSFVKAMAKCRSHGFFLGMDETWLDL